MLFNSYIFLFVFFPIVFIVYFVLGRLTPLAATAWLAGASLFFYAAWEWDLIYLLLASIVFNYTVGVVIGRSGASRNERVAKWTMIFGVTADLLCLIYFKYMNFFVGQLEQALHVDFSLPAIILPLGISFFTFTQIAFLVDSWRTRSHEPNFIQYLLFVSYFPHLIAGPILHYAEIIPQLKRSETFRPRAEAIAIGMTVFAFGLFKKVVLADSIAPFADAAFDAKHSLGMIETWCGVMAYTFQIYFDFSAYSDMAVGISRMLNIQLPVNFNSPYKSLSIIEFWRRWHITLSRWLRDYLYIPLGGNKYGPINRYRNLMITMALGGLWHGAGWTFLIWGALHGLYLCANHAWRYVAQDAGIRERTSGPIWRLFYWALTFVSVMIGWVFFRSPDLHTAIMMLKGMAGLHGLQLPIEWAPHLGRGAPYLLKLGVGFATLPGFLGAKEMIWIVTLFLIATCLPNLQRLMARHELALGTEKSEASQEALPVAQVKIFWRPTAFWAAASVAVFTLSVILMTKISPFLYFQF